MRRTALAFAAASNACCCCAASSTASDRVRTSTSSNLSEARLPTRPTLLYMCCAIALCNRVSRGRRLSPGELARGEGTVGVERPRLCRANSTNGFIRCMHQPHVCTHGHRCCRPQSALDNNTHLQQSFVSNQALARFSFDRRV